MRSQEERKFENDLIKKVLKSKRDELYAVEKHYGHNERLKLENSIRAAVRKKSGKLFQKKKAASQKSENIGGVSWISENGAYKGYVDGEVLFEIKKGASIYNLYYNKKYSGCSTEKEKLMKKAINLMNDASF